VVDDQRVEVGDTLGFVGNTGNARTTPPHLHFGVYRRREGPVDPYPFLNTPRARLAEQTADPEQLGDWVRLIEDGIRLREGPARGGAVLRELDQYTPLRVFGGSGEYYRVRLPDGVYGYVAARLTEPADRPFSTEVVMASRQIRSAPNKDALVITRLDAGAEVPVLGRFDGYLFVVAPSGHTGWMGEQQQRP
jgi:SH3-like domain-containing protein